MNPGYTAGFLLLVCCILFAFDWKKPLVGEVSGRSVWLFLALMAAGTQIDLTIGSHRIPADLPFLAGWCAIILLQGKGSQPRTLTLLAAGFIGLFDWLLTETSRIAPGVHAVSSASIIALYTALLAGSLVKQPIRQAAAITMGLIASAALSFFLRTQEFPSVGDFNDKWWMTVAAARLYTIARTYLAEAGKLAVERWAAVWKGRRS